MTNAYDKHTLTFEEWWSEYRKNDHVNTPLWERQRKRKTAKAAWQAAQPQWRPISTAPTDEFILMYLPLAHGDYEIHLLAIAEYGLVDIFNDVTTYGIDDFTHWMPLPEPPRSEK